jgi:hypothetical protein
MRTLRTLFKPKVTTWNLVGGLLLVGLLGGCTTPLVNVAVQVDTCPSGGGGPRTPLDPPGYCSINSTAPYNGPLIPQNYKVCKAFDGTTINCTGNEMCTGSTSRVCNDPPGNDSNRKPCKSVWKQSAAGSMNGDCSCYGL